MALIERNLSNTSNFYEDWLCFKTEYEKCIVETFMIPEDILLGVKKKKKKLTRWEMLDLE